MTHSFIYNTTDSSYLFPEKRLEIPPKDYLKVSEAEYNSGMFDTSTRNGHTVQYFNESEIPGKVKKEPEPISSISLATQGATNEELLDFLKAQKDKGIAQLRKYETTKIELETTPITPVFATQTESFNPQVLPASPDTTVAPISMEDFKLSTSSVSDTGSEVKGKTKSSRKTSFITPTETETQ